MRSLPLLKSVINSPRGRSFPLVDPMGIVIASAYNITIFKEAS